MIKMFLTTIFGFLLYAAVALAAVNINSASLDALSALPYIGPVKAQAIIDYREQHGPFLAVDDLSQVKGIGEKTVDRIRDLIVVESQ